MHLKLTASCSHRCRHCAEVSGDGPDDPVVSLDAVRRLHAANLLAPVLTLTGGEPTLAPEFREIVTFLASNSYALHLQTNFAYPDHSLYPFVASAFRGVMFSYHSIDRDAFARTCGNRDAYDHVSFGLSSLAELTAAHGTGFMINVVQTELNMSSLPDTLSHLCRFDAEIKLSACQLYGRALGGHRHVFPDLARASAQACRLGSVHPRVRLHDFYPCLVPASIMRCSEKPTFEGPNRHQSDEYDHRYHAPCESCRHRGGVCPGIHDEVVELFGLSAFAGREGT